ncbi:hypothetical protein CLOP_g24752 [Closterium sp. NIES-67]|nr:hypothetical protein CLOP_g24752 [Closterium sp. NIES-67]
MGLLSGKYHCSLPANISRNDQPYPSDRDRRAPLSDLESEKFNRAMPQPAAEADAVSSSALADHDDATPASDRPTSANAATPAVDAAQVLAGSLGLHQGSNNENIIFQDPSWRLVKYRGRYAEAEGRYPVDNPRVATAVRAYAEVARQFQLSPVQLAISFVLAHPLVGAAVVGASSMDQLEEILSVVGKGSEGGGDSVYR